MRTGWRTRGYLPHRDQEHLVQHLVFNLADALPRQYDGADDDQQRRTWIDAELDAGHRGEQLSVPANAQAVEDCLLRDHGVRYVLAAWCVMPNHVHVLAEQWPGHDLSSIVQTWKSVSAHVINKCERRRGPLWQREYFDRFMRNASQFDAAANYVENNPVAAGLVERAEDWRFSSAWSGRATNAGEGAGAPEG